MKTAVLVILRTALAAVSLAGFANAQDVAVNKRVASTPGQALTTPDVEPAALSGMLAAQNQVRTRLGLEPLTWSADLSASAAATAASAAEGACSLGSTARAVRGEDVSLYWAAAIRRFGGDDVAQDISNAYVVSRWNEGRSAYDPEGSTCRNNSSECAAYARLVAPAHREVGCAYMRCPSQAQLWICRYGA